MKSKIISASVIFLTLLSCSVHRTVYDRLDPKTDKPENEIYLISNDATKRGSYFIKTSKGFQYISEPPPDVALSVTKEISNKIDYSKISDDSKVNIVESISALGQRTAAVNILRDAMYKLAELKLNNDALDPTTVELFDKILKVAENIAVGQNIDSKKNAENAEANKIQKQIELKKLDLSLGAKSNYDIAIKFLLDKDLDNAKEAFNDLYLKYPTHFNIDEINKKIKPYNSKIISKDDWINIYKYILHFGKYGISDDTWQNLKAASKE